MSTRRTLGAKGRQGRPVTVVVEVCRGKVWVVSVDSPFVTEAIFEPAQADSLSALLTEAAKDARKYKS